MSKKKLTTSSILKEREQKFQRKEAFTGVELVQDAHRLALMNAMLHDIEGKILLGGYALKCRQGIQGL